MMAEWKNPEQEQRASHGSSPVWGVFSTFFTSQTVL
jgi:hypothetical protein